MAMTLKEALAVRLPSGKTIGEATAEEWQAHAEACSEAASKLEAADHRHMTEADREAMRYGLERAAEFHEAMAVIKDHLRKS